MLQNEYGVRPGKYRHYKGNEYEVIAVARHVDTSEEFVVYRALYGKQELFIRSKSEFLEYVYINGVSIPRFEFIDDISSCTANSC